MSDFAVGAGLRSDQLWQKLRNKGVNPGRGAGAPPQAPHAAPTRGFSSTDGRAAPPPAANGQGAGAGALFSGSSAALEMWQLAAQGTARDVPVNTLIRKGTDAELRDNHDRIIHKQRQRGKTMMGAAFGGLISALSVGTLYAVSWGSAVAKTALSQGVGGGAVAMDPTGTFVALAIFAGCVALWGGTGIRAIKTNNRLEKAGLPTR